jgi:hypothetical protein
MQKTLVWGSILGVVLTFQNCAKPQNLETAGQPIGVVTYNKTPVSNYSHIALFDGISRPFKYWNLDLVSGEASAVNESGGNLGSRICLGPSKLQELSQILDQAEVCEPILKDSTGVLCTQEYAYPYAVLSENADQVGLGEKADGCAGVIDLCGQKSKQLQSFVSGIISNISSYSCN